MTLKNMILCFLLIKSCFLAIELLTTFRCSRKCWRLIANGQNSLHAIQPSYKRRPSSCTKLRSLSFPSRFPFFDGEKGYSWGGRMRRNLFWSKYWYCISSHLVGVFVCQKFELKCPSVQPSRHLHIHGFWFLKWNCTTSLLGSRMITLPSKHGLYASEI